MLSRANQRVHAHCFTTGHPVLQRPCFLERNHERERRGRGKGVEMSPAHEVLVFAPPGRPLVLGETDDPGGTKARDREFSDRFRLLRREHQLAPHVLPFVVTG